MLLVEKSRVGVYNYQGKLISLPRWPNMKLEYLTLSLITISSDTLAVRDMGDSKGKFLRILFIIFDNYMSISIGKQCIIERGQIFQCV